MPFCPYCGSATVPDGQFCPNCGRLLPTKTEPADGGEPRAADVQPFGTDAGAPPPNHTGPVFRVGPDDASAPIPAEAGASDPAVVRSSLPPEFAPPVLDAPLPVNFNPSDLPGTHPDWKMSPAEPYVPRRQRPRWLLIVAGVLGACLLVCVAVVVFVNTPPGQRLLSNQATQAARAATPVPGGVVGTPVR